MTGKTPILPLIKMNPVLNKAVQQHRPPSVLSFNLTRYKGSSRATVVWLSNGTLIKKCNFKFNIAHFPKVAGSLRVFGHVISFISAKKCKAFCVPVLAKLAEAHHHYVQTSRIQFSSKSDEKCENYERKLIYLWNTILSSPCPSRPAVRIPQPLTGCGLGL